MKTRRVRRIKKIWEGEAFSTFSQCSPGETLSDLQGTQHHDQKKRHWPHDHHSSGLARVVQGGSTSDSDESDQVPCIPYLSEVYTYLKLILVLQDFLMILTSPSLPSRTSGSPTDPSSAPPSLNPQTQLNWIRSDQLDYMNVVWPWSFLIMIVVENMFFRRWFFTKICYAFEFHLLYFWYYP